VGAFLVFILTLSGLLFRWPFNNVKYLEEKEEGPSEKEKRATL
jgi:hypothetical protein